MATERGRVFGEPGGGAHRVPPRHPRGRRGARRATRAGGHPLLVEEEGWLEDGTPLIVDGAAPSAVGDDGIWFLPTSATRTLPVYVVVSAQGRYLVDGDGLPGAAGDDPLVDELAGLSVDELDGADRRVASLIGRAAIIPRCRPDPSASASPPPASPAAWRCALSLPPFGFWPLAVVGPGRPRSADRRPARGGAVPPGLARGHGVLRAVADLDDGAHRARLRDRLRALRRHARRAASPPHPRAAGAGWRWPARGPLAELLRWTWPFGGVPLGQPRRRPGGRAPGAGAAGRRQPAAAPRHRARRAGGGRGRRAARGDRRPACWPPSRWWSWPARCAPRGHDVGTAEVALVQGGGEQGTRKTDAGVIEVFERHVDATALVEPPVDLVVWPEDVIDTDGAFDDDPWADVVGDLARSSTRRWSSAPWRAPDPSASATPPCSSTPTATSSAATTRSTACPFGEFVPFRSLLEQVAGDALPDRDALIGELPGHLDVPGPVGRVAVPISWEIFFPDRTREGVEDGARLVLNPTNGASFSGTIVQTPAGRVVAPAGHRDRALGGPGRAHRVHRGDRRPRPRARAHRRSASGASSSARSSCARASRSTPASATLPALLAGRPPDRRRLVRWSGAPLPTRRSGRARPSG